MYILYIVIEIFISVNFYCFFFFSVYLTYTFLHCIFIIVFTCLLVYNICHLMKKNMMLKAWTVSRYSDLSIT